jgi:hypothetical protein
MSLYLRLAIRLGFTNPVALTDSDTSRHTGPCVNGGYPSGSGWSLTHGSVCPRLSPSVSAMGFSFSAIQVLIGGVDTINSRLWRR